MHIAARCTPAGGAPRAVGCLRERLQQMSEILINRPPRVYSYAHTPSLIRGLALTTVTPTISRMLGISRRVRLLTRRPTARQRT